MFWELLCPSSGARQSAVAASGFRMNVEVEVFSVVVDLSTGCRVLSEFGKDRITTTRILFKFMYE
jgi:hypothetical protein